MKDSLFQHWQTDNEDDVTTFVSGGSSTDAAAPAPLVMDGLFGANLPSKMVMNWVNDMNTPTSQVMDREGAAPAPAPLVMDRADGPSAPASLVMDRIGGSDAASSLVMDRVGGSDLPASLVMDRADGPSAPASLIMDREDGPNAPVSQVMDPEGDDAQSAVLPVFDNDQIADFLVYDWLDGASFNVAPGGTLTVNVSALNDFGDGDDQGQFFALKALEAWTMVTGINFQTTTSASANIVFDDEAAGAFAGPTSWSGYGGTIYASSVNVSEAWTANYTTGWGLDAQELNSYTFQTYVHEIGHALGLGHAGNYNGSANYAEDGSGDNHYLNDSWQATVMSYFSQTENTWVDANYNFLATPMIADILAMQELYGTATDLRLGATVYGEGSTAGGYYDTEIQADRAFTIIDNGGVDTIDFSSVTAGQNVNLREETISDVGGEIGNMSIARGTTIENFFSGSGNDTIKGNAASNWIKGGSGDDLIKGFDGADDLNGNHGADKLVGGNGNDIMRGGGGADRLWGGDGDDILSGGAGRDKLHGGAGADTFVFKTGMAVDRVKDFENDVDTLQFDEGLWGGGLTVQEVVDTYGTYNAANGWVEFHFDADNKIKVYGIFDKQELVNDIEFI